MRFPRDDRNGEGRLPGAGAASGFTIVELVVVLILIGLLTTIVAPQVRVDRFRVGSSVNSVSGALRIGQRTAMVNQHDVVLAFDVDNAMVRVHEDQNNDGDLQSSEPVRYVALEDATYFDLGGASAMAIGAGPVSFSEKQDGLPAITYRRNGSASEEGVVYITSGRAMSSGEYAEDSRALVIRRGTGRVSCFRYMNNDWEEEC